MSSSGADWGDGYVTDTAYLPGYYHHQSPLHLNLACLLGGVTGLAITPESSLSYLELGCGCGFGALALAASNPNWQVTGIDFSPAHIAAARELAAEAGIANAQFIEGDLADFADCESAKTLPEADVITLHGLWSWVGDPVRAGIVRLIDRKLRPGGLVYVSYNALPGWQQAIGMQRLVREAGQRDAGRSDRQVEAGIEVVWDVSPGLPLVQADHHSLLQVFVNLARNSQQALENCERRQVRIAASLESDLVVPNKDELLYVAIRQAKSMYDTGYRPPLKREFPVAGRSAKATDFLRSVGFNRVKNLKGGILDWIDKVDPSQPKY